MAMQPFTCTLWGVFTDLVLAVVGAGCSVSDATSVSCVPTACGNGATFDVCTKTDSNDVCIAKENTVGGQSFVCNTCQDCGQANTQAAQACAGLGPGDGGSDAGNGTTCAAANPCGTSTVKYQECTTVGATGECASIAYRTTDGHTFTCSSCTSCTSAEQQLSSYCGSTMDMGTDAGGPVTTCDSAVSCGSLTYQECTTSTNGACDSIAYQVSDGATYACASCGDCSAATSQLDDYCASQSQPTTTCGTSYDCGTGGLTYSECTTTSGGVCQSIEYQLSSGGGYTCASCSDCSAALDDVSSYCTSQSNGSTSCGGATACGTGGVTWSQCTTDTGSTCDDQYYSTTDGQTFACAACGDCSVAVSSLDSYCASLGTSSSLCTTTCGSAATCCDCSGTGVCYTLETGETCATFGCTSSE